MKFANILPAAAAALVILSSACHREPEFRINGDVYGGEGKTLVLAKSDFIGRWIAVDSVKIGSDGRFSIKSTSPASPEIYRLSLGNQFIYLPVDSTESVRLETSLDKFGSDFKLSGTPKADLMTAFEHELINYNPSDSAAAANFKRGLYTRYIQDSKGSIMSYYILTKVVGGKPLYDAEDPMDAKYYAAVATQFEQFRPDDPHGKMVRDVSIAGLRKRNADNGRRKVYEATELSVVDIDLPDENGRNRKLSEIVGKGQPVAVIFAMMNTDQSPAFNRDLATLYNRLGGKVEFYNVSVDADNYAWRDAARNLPWITVIDAGGMSSDALLRYNVRVLPAFYIYDASGELVDSAFDLEDFNRKISRY